MVVPLSIFVVLPVMNFLAPSSSYAWWIFGTPMMVNAVKTSIQLAQSNYNHERVEELASEVREKTLLRYARRVCLNSRVKFIHVLDLW